jgi:hypothetical protein
MAELQDILGMVKELPVSEQHKALSELLPGFKDLPEGEQIKGMAEIMGKVQAPIQPIPQAPAEDPMAAQVGMIGQSDLPSIDKGQAQVAGAMITAPFKSTPIMAPISGMGAAAGAILSGGNETPPMGNIQQPDVMGASLSHFNAPLDAFGMGVAGEAGGQAVMGAAKKLLGPFAGTFAAKVAGSPETKAAQEMVEQGVPLSPGGYQPTKTSRAFQWIADNFMPGSLIVNKRRQEVSDAILKMRQEFIENTLGMPKYTESIPQAQAKTRELFGQFAEQAGGKETLIPMTNTVKFIEDNLSNPITTTDTWWKKKFTPWMKGGEAKSIDDINTLHATYNRGWNKLTPVGKDLRNGIRESIYKDLAENDLQTGLQLEEALKTAQAAAKTPRDIAKSRWIENALLDPATKIEDQSYVFFPAQFKTQVNKNITKIEQMFGQEGVDTFIQFADKMMLAAPDMGKLGKVSDATAKFRQASGVGLLGPAGLAAAGQPGLAAALAVPYGFQTIVAKSLMNPEGWMRKWLTTGIQPSKLLTKEVPKIGIMEALND